MTLTEIQNQIDAFRKQTPQLNEYNNAPTGSDFAEQLRTRLTSGESVENIIKNVAQQRARLLAIPAETRAEMPIGVYSPTQTAGLIAAREEPVRTSYETLMGVKQAREGRMEDIIDRATKGYEAQIEKQKVKYEQERQKMKDLIEERSWLVQQSQYSAEQAESKRRWEVEQAQKTILPKSITGANYNTRLSTEISNLYAGRYGTEGAREKVISLLKNEFPSVDVASDIYNRIPDRWEKQMKTPQPVKWENDAAIWQWLATEGKDLSDEEKAQQIMEAGSNPESFGIYGF